MIRFTKMQAAGSDFIVVNNIEENISPELFPELAINLCQRRFSVGACGIIILSGLSKPTDSAVLSKPAELKSLIYDEGGGRVRLSGAGQICAARYCFDRMLNASDRLITISGDAGLMPVWKISESVYKVKIPEITRIDTNLTVDIDGRNILCHYVEIGPTGSLITEWDLDSAYESELRIIGNRLNQCFGQHKKTNVSFVKIIDNRTIKVKTYEYGVQEFSYACDIGSCAAVSVLMTKGKKSMARVYVQTAGGIQIVDGTQQEGKIELFLTGEAKNIYSGKIYIP